MKPRFSRVSAFNLTTGSQRAKFRRIPFAFLAGPSGPGHGRLLDMARTAVGVGAACADGFGDSYVLVYRGRVLQ